MNNEIFTTALEEARRKGAHIQPPASVEDLRQCQTDLKKRGFPAIPQRYFAFLKNICNGYDHEVAFYGTKPFQRKPFDSSYGIVESIVTVNEERNEDMKRYRLLIGGGWSTVYFFNLQTGQYETRERGGGELLRDYKRFQDMFECETLRG